MVRWFRPWVLVALVFALTGGVVHPGETESVPWKLGFELLDFNRVQVPDRLGGAKTVWYVLYRVTNDTGQEIPNGVHFALKTDTGKVHRESFNPQAKALAEKKEKRELKGSADRPKTFADGESFEGIAILGELDPEMDRADLIVSGLQDVVSRIGRKRVYEKKALIYEWKRPGDRYWVLFDPVRPVRVYWKTIEGPRVIE